jgi:hypothetical protein
MQSKKLTVYSMPEFVGKIVELTKDGKEIDLNWTRASYGLSYTVAYFEEVTFDEPATEVAIEAEATTDVASEATESVADSSETTVAAKPKGRPKASA